MILGDSMIKKIDLTAGVWLAALLLFVVSVTDNFVIRLILTLPLACFLTGHTVLRAIKPVQSIRPLEHSVFSAGVGITVCVGGGFLLNLFSMLNPIGWAIWLMVVNALAMLIALRQSYEPFVLPELPEIRVWHAYVLCAAISIASGSYVLAAYVMDTNHQFTYTEFWLVPEASAGKLVVGVRSHETEREQYDIEVIGDKSVISVFRSIDLAPGDRWFREITVSLSQSRVEANLYRARDHALYRKVSALIRGAG
jgi:uncharacterized membrane protein